jgi:uncharacterized membrane protein YagU involved in acid resistance
MNRPERVKRLDYLEGRGAQYAAIYRVSNNNCFSWQKKILHKIFKTVYLFRFVLLTLLIAGIHFKFKRLGFCNLLLIK